MKKILTSVIVGVLVLAMVPFSAFAEENSVADETGSAETYLEQETADSQEELADESAVLDEVLSDEVSEETPEAVTEESTETVNNSEEDVLTDQAENLSAPKLEKLTIAETGLEITYDAVKKAESYNIYRKAEGEQSFTKIANTLDTYYTDTNVTTGVTYTYTVSAVTSGGKESAYDETGLSEVFVGASQITKCTYKSGTVSLKWQEVEGATGYCIYARSDSKDLFKVIEVVTGAEVTEYNYTKLKSATYEFVVRAYVQKDSTKIKGYWDENYIKSVKCLATPTFKVTASPTGNKITITKDSAAKKYRIYKKVNGKWDYLKTTTKTAFIDKNVESGKYYTYTVRSISSDGLISGYNANGKSRGWVKPAVISSASCNGAGCVTLKWSKADSGAKYIVYRKTKGSDYKIVKITKRTTFKDKTVANNTKYTYYVKVKEKINGKSYFSGYTKKSVKSIKTFTGPKGAMISKAQNYSSPTNYMILIDCANNYLGVFTGSQGNWKLQSYWRCSTGAGSTPTVKGVFSITENRGYVFGEGYSCYYYSGFYGGYLIHSILYYENTFTPMDPTLGGDVSHGCVRLTLDHAKWIYYNIPVGTTVVTYGK